MKLKLITNFGLLLRLAHKEAQARLNGTEEEYEKAKAEHEAYAKLCLKADEMIVPGLER